MEIEDNYLAKSSLIFSPHNYLKFLFVFTVQVELPNLPPEDKGFEFSFTAVDLAPEEEALLEIVWTPTEAGTWRESIPVRTSSKLKSEFVLLCSSIDPQPKKVCCVLYIFT